MPPPRPPATVAEKSPPRLKLLLVPTPINIPWPAALAKPPTVAPMMTAALVTDTPKAFPTMVFNTTLAPAYISKTAAANMITISKKLVFFLCPPNLGTEPSASTV